MKCSICGDQAIVYCKFCSDPFCGPCGIAHDAMFPEFEERFWPAEMHTLPASFDIEETNK